MNARNLLVSGLCLFALLVPAAMAGPGVSPTVGSSGPFAGTVKQGETDTYTYNNNPLNNPCIQVMTTYTVTLTHTPATDDLTLTVKGQSSATGGDGFTAITVDGSWCTSFGISVTGTDVALVSAYEVSVVRHAPGVGGGT